MSILLALHNRLWHMVSVSIESVHRLWLDGMIRFPTFPIKSHKFMMRIAWSNQKRWYMLCIQIKHSKRVHQIKHIKRYQISQTGIKVNFVSHDSDASAWQTHYTYDIFMIHSCSAFLHFLRFVSSGLFKLRCLCAYCFHVIESFYAEVFSLIWIRSDVGKGFSRSYKLTLGHIRCLLPEFYCCRCAHLNLIFAGHSLLWWILIENAL